MAIPKTDLRPCRKEDVPFLFRLYASTREAEMSLVDWSAAEKSAFLRMQFDAQSRYYADVFSHARFEVIELEGRAIGRLYVEQRDDVIHVIDIALLPEWRGKGIGSRIMKAILNQAASARLPVQIHVEQFNPAMRLYLRLGFRPIRHDGVYMLMKWDGMDTAANEPGSQPPGTVAVFGSSGPQGSSMREGLHDDTT
jgi:GNAT superfamily N-acetyltransferase